MMRQDDLKRAVGYRAARLIEDDMVVGLGSGSTVYYLLEKMKELIDGGMRIQGIPSSERTAEWARHFGIPLTTFEQVEMVDLTIDGADEVDPNFQLIKGGGGSLVREKIVASHSKKVYIIVDETKLVSQLGAFYLPIEVVPFGWRATAGILEKLGLKWALREREGEVFVSNNGNYILDCDAGVIERPSELHERLKKITGVVETGLFINLVDGVFVGTSDGVRFLERL